MDEFQNSQIFETDFPDFEQVDFIPVSPKYLKIVLLNTAILSVILLMAACIGYYFVNESLQGRAWMVFVPLLFLILYMFVYRYFAFFRRKYAVREEDIIYRYGLLQEVTEIVPFKRIQHVALAEGWYSRMLGLKTVMVFTAGSGGTDLTINGIPKDIAENINQLILNKIKDEKKPEIEMHTEDSGNSAPDESSAAEAEHNSEDDAG